MTIKEAFESLSSACAKGMKNPFFVMRRLKESFADVADKVVDAGGSVVEVEAELTEGTEIGSITVDGEETVLYAPAGGGSSAWTLAGSGTGTSPRITLPEANEYLLVSKYSSTFHSILVTPNELINGTVLKVGYYQSSSYNTGVAFAYDLGTNKIRLDSSYNNNENVISNTTFYVYYR